MTITTYPLTILASELAGGEGIADADYVIQPQPVGTGFTAAQNLAGTSDVRGVLDGGGGAVVDLAPSPTGQWYELDIFGVGRWRFQMPEQAANCAEQAEAFGPVAPVGPVPGPPGPPGPSRISGYLYLQDRALTFTPVTAKTTAAASWTVTLLDDSIAGGITAGIDFVTEYEGALLIDLSATTNYKITLTNIHHFNDGTKIQSARVYQIRLQQAAAGTVPLNLFNSRSVISLGTFTDNDGNTITVTEALLAQSVRIELTLTVERIDGNNFAVDSASMELGKAHWWQLSSIKPDPTVGPQGPPGRDGGYTIDAYLAAASSPSSPTVLGTFDPTDPANNVAPTGWTFAVPSYDEDTLNLYAIRAFYQPDPEGTPYEPTYTIPYEAGGHGTPGPAGPGGKTGPTGPGVAAGGSSGQVLAKASATDFDTEWIDPGGGGTGDVVSKLPISGVGNSADPLTIGPGAIQADRLAAGVIPDVSGLATTAALDAEAHERLTADNSLSNRIDDEATHRVTQDAILAAAIQAVPGATKDNVYAADETIFKPGQQIGLDFDSENRQITVKTEELLATEDQAVPAGGSTGQVLTKKSNTDLDTEWKDVQDPDITIHVESPITGASTSADPLTIANGSIEAKHIKDSTLTAEKFANDQIGARQLTPTQELPTIASGDAGKVVTAKADRSGFTLSDEAGATVTTKLPVSGSGAQSSPVTIEAGTIKPEHIEANSLGAGQLVAGQVLPDVDAAHAGRVVTVKADGSGFELDAPTSQANVYPFVDAIIQAMDNSPTVDGIVSLDEAQDNILRLGSSREIIGTDWGNLPVGFSFRFGHIVPRSGEWYVCIVPHAKGGVGPDNDSTHWDAITTWTGTYSGTRWYHAGQIVLLSTGQIAQAKIDLSPNATEPTQTDSNWWVPGTVSGAAVGHYVSLIDDESPDSGTVLEVTDLLQNDIIDLTLTATAASSGSGNVRLNPDATLVRLDNHTRFQVSPRNGQTRTASAQYRYIGTSGSAQIQYQFTDTKPETVTAAAVVPQHTAPFTPSADNIYPVDKQIFKAGNNVEQIYDDTLRQIITNVRLPDEASPRVYALDSRDVRTVQPPYSYNQIWRGFNLQPGTEHTVHGGNVSVHDRDDTKPGFQNDFDNGRRNSNGVDFTNATAGTTTRTIGVSVEVEPANERQYSSAETVTLRIYTYGRLKPKSTDTDNHLTFTKVWHFAGGYQDAFTYDFDLTYSGKPRSGEHDSYRLTVEWETGSGEVVQGVINAVKETFTLPALGSIPKQGFTHNSARHVDTLADWIPPELKSQITSASRILTWAVGTPNNTGKNAPSESDKADVTDPVVRFGTNDGSALDKPFLRAEQDLSRVKLHFAGGATLGGDDVYLCTRIQGFPAEVLANTSVTSAWTLDYTAQGAMSLQDFYLLDPSGGGVGSPSATWDANPGGPRINNVIDGIFHTAHLTAGINFTPIITNEFSIDDDELNEAAEAGLLHVIRIRSNDVVGEVPLRGIPRPVPFGSGATNRLRLGDCFLKPHASQGGASTHVWVDPYRDIHGMHFALKGTDGTPVSAYVSGAEIEYALYRT